MRGLKIVLLSADPERLRGALASAAAYAAMGGDAHIFFQMDAATLLADLSAPRDKAHAQAGMPTLATLMDDALTLGVTLTACQSGLTLAGIDAVALDPRVTIGGTVSFLQSVTDEDRLLFV